MRKILYIVAAMRPQQWTKNVVLFAGLIFSGNLANKALLLRSVEAFVIFCALSGVIYLFNDVADIEKDRLHERKRERPLPSGKLQVRDALAAATVVGAVALFFAFKLGPSFFVVAVIFFGLNLLYSFVFKRIALLDVLSIAMSFVLRAIAGVEALVDIDATIQLSPWLLICTLFLALFLGVCKRRHELLTLTDASAHREALAEYSPQLVDQLVAMAASGSVLSYSIYTIWPETVANFGTKNLVYTIPLVVLGVMRYLYLVYSKDKGGSPSDMLLHERFLLLTVFAWVLLVVAIFYVF